MNAMTEKGGAMGLPAMIGGERREREGVVWYSGFSIKSAQGYSGDDEFALHSRSFVEYEWEATYRWAGRMADGSIVDYCEGDMSYYPADENEDIEKCWKLVLEYIN